MPTTPATDANFDTEVLKADKPVVVDFWAEWCGPCKSIAPVLEEIAEEQQEKVRVMKLNVDENPNTPRTYGIRGIPTLILFTDGEPHATKVGELTKAQLEEWLESTL